MITKTELKIIEILNLFYDVLTLESELNKMSQKDRDLIYEHPIFDLNGEKEVRKFLLP